MKTRNFFLAVLPMMAAAFVMTACSSDDSTTEAPQPTGGKTFPYTVTVSSGDATRATVDSDNKTLRFAAGDKLYVWGDGASSYGYNVSGVLNIQTGAGETSATFSGTLSAEIVYGGSYPDVIDDNFELNATLVSAQQTLGTEFSVTSEGRVDLLYSNDYCPDVATAVQKYSLLESSGTSKYSVQAFTLEQKTAFLNFVITFEDGTASNSTLQVVVKQKNGVTLGDANVTTETEGGKVVAKFVCPVLASLADLNGATVKMGDKPALPIANSSISLIGKVYNINRTQKAIRTLSSATSSDIGKVVGADGNIYDTAAEANAASTALAMIAYVSGTQGLAISLVDVGSSTTRFDEASTACTSHTAVTGYAWKLPSKEDWEHTLTTADLDTKLTTAGGTALGTYYWTSTLPEDMSSTTNAYRLVLSGGMATFESTAKDGGNNVRAVLAF